MTTTKTFKNEIQFDPFIGKFLKSNTMGYTFFFEKDVESDTMSDREFKALGRTTWVLFAAPPATGGYGCDFDNGVAVEDWDLKELNREQLAELFDIQARMYDVINGHHWYR